MRFGLLIRTHAEPSRAAWQVLGWRQVLAPSVWCRPPRLLQRQRAGPRQVLRPWQPRQGRPADRQRASPLTAPCLPCGSTSLWVGLRLVFCRRVVLPWGNQVSVCAVRVRGGAVSVKRVKSPFWLPPGVTVPPRACEGCTATRCTGAGSLVRGICKSGLESSMHRHQRRAKDRLQRLAFVVVEIERRRAFNVVLS